MGASFAIDYRNARRPVEEPERFESYDLISAHYDYLPAGPSATIVIGEYSLELEGLLFVDWIRQSLSLAERIVAKTPDDQDDLRRFLPGLPREANVHFWIAADIPINPPVLLFASAREELLIYTRVSASVGGPELMCGEGDKQDPTSVPYAVVLAVITKVLVGYLDDLAAAFPFIEQDDIYLEHRRRIAALTAV